MAAWLDTPPRDDKGNVKTARRESYTGPIPLPGPLEYLFAYLCESGPLTTWSEIKAWSELSGVELDSFEATTLWRLSCVYVDQQRLAIDVNCPAPWVDDDLIDDDAVAEKTKQIFSLLK
jgi:hypothetical protein